MNAFRHIRLTLLLFLVIPALASAQAISTSGIYVNQDIGVRAAFDNGWEIVTTRDQAPAPLKPNFPENKRPNDSPLFIGIHDGQELYMRLLSETFFDDLEAYAGILAQGIESQGLRITAAKLSMDNSAMELRYMHPQLGLTFLERIALLPDSQVIRMALWTTSNVWEAYAADVDRAFAAVELRNVINAGDGWQTAWAGLEDNLLAGNIEGIALAQARPLVLMPKACADPTSSMLWKVEGDTLDANQVELYLFGSIHVGKESFYPLPEEIEAPFRDADFLVFEVDPQSVADPAVMLDMQSRGMLPAGQSLGDVVSADVVADFRRVMMSMGLPADNFMGMQPWFLTLMLTGLQMNALGYQPQFGLENYFLTRKSGRTRILELESIRQQIGFLEALNAESYLALTIQSLEEGNEEVEALIADWQCADRGPLADKLFPDLDDEALTERERSDMAMLMDQLYTRRNIDMAETIGEFVEGEPGSYFVVVGSAHLLGETSVVELLRGTGLRVEPVRLTP